MLKFYANLTHVRIYIYGGVIVKNKEKPIKSIKEKITDMLDMPKDVMLDSPKVTIIGDNYLTVENYNGIMEYTDKQVRIKTSKKSITISGDRLEIRTITDSDILIEGIIQNVRWE